MCTENNVDKNPSPHEGDNLCDLGSDAQIQSPSGLEKVDHFAFLVESFGNGYHDPRR